MQSKHANQVHLADPLLPDPVFEAGAEALRNERYLFGESTYRFEERFAKYCGVRHGVSTNSGTSALMLALRALGLGAQERVEVPSFTFVASANAVTLNGGVPELVDVDTESRVMTWSNLKAEAPNLRGIMPVHLFGQPAEMKGILEFAADRGLFVIEDACQAHGARFDGRRVGAIGDVGCFSFYPSKNLTVYGDGGMMVTNDEEVASKVASLRDCGRKTKYEHDLVGYTMRMNNVNAAMGLAALNYLDRWNEHRRHNAELYNRLLRDTNGISLPPNSQPRAEPVFHLYTITIENRDQLAEHLAAEGIETGVHYPIPVHLQPAYIGLIPQGTLLPNSEYLASHILSLPCHPGLTDTDVGSVCECVKGFVGRLR